MKEAKSSKRSLAKRGVLQGGRDKCADTEALMDFAVQRSAGSIAL